MLDSKIEVIESALRIKPTIGNSQWLLTNRIYVNHSLPELWTPIADSGLHLRFGLAMRMVGVEWRHVSDLILAMAWLTRVGIAEVNPQCCPGDHVCSLIIRRFN